MNLKDILSDAIDQIYDLSVTRVNCFPKINILDNELHYHTVERWGRRGLDDGIGRLPVQQEMEAIKDVVYHVAIRNQVYIDEIIGNFDDVYVEVTNEDIKEN